MEKIEELEDVAKSDEPRILGEVEVTFTNIDNHRFAGDGCQRITYCSCDCNDFCWTRCLAK